MKFLTRREFENKNFVHYLRTGEFYFYEAYLKWFAKLEFKSAKEEDDEDDEVEEEQSKKKDDLISIFLPDGDTKCIWSGGSCGACSGMAGMEFTIDTMPGEIHPNCTCTCNVIDDEGEFTGEKIKPKPKKPKKNCAKVTSSFGNRKDPFTGNDKMHKGVDFYAPKGTSINAIEGGKVTRSGAEKSENLKEGFGYRVTIQHQWGSSTYAHMNDVPDVEVGDMVEAGDKIGEVGESGRSSGVHLHFEMKDKNGKPIEPSEEQIQDLLDMLNEGCK